jgi:hypothetical protein
MPIAAVLDSVPLDSAVRDSNAFVPDRIRPLFRIGRPRQNELPSLHAQASAPVEISIPGIYLV